MSRQDAHPGRLIWMRRRLSKVIGGSAGWLGVRKVLLLGFAAGMAARGAATSLQTSRFTNEEYVTLRRIVGDILPTDDTAGANEARITEFLLYFLAARGEAAVGQCKRGIAATNEMAFALHQRAFNDLKDADRRALLGAVATHPQMKTFWDMVRSLTVFRFYSLPLGYKPIGLPGPNIDSRRFRHADRAPGGAYDG